MFHQAGGAAPPVQSSPPSGSVRSAVGGVFAGGAASTRVFVFVVPRWPMPPPPLPPPLESVVTKKLYTVVPSAAYVRSSASPVSRAFFHSAVYAYGAAPPLYRSRPSRFWLPSWRGGRSKPYVSTAAGGYVGMGA